MQLLFSNVPPLRINGCQSSFSCFEKSFLETSEYRMASGYISADALADLKNLFEANNKKFLELVIGMHAFEGMTEAQYQSTKYLDDFLRENKAGGVRLATTFRYHGKAYSFLNAGNPVAAILGSSNLSSIFDVSTMYETDIYLTEGAALTRLDGFLKDLSEKACIPFADWKPKIIETEGFQLDGITGVVKLSAVDAKVKETGLYFDIPLKSDDALKSNLNAYHGKGREDKRGLIKTRHWYEIELIVPSSVTRKTGYPKPLRSEKNREITVITDDGWSFKCQIDSKSNNFKNFRSSDNLKILGRWIKGRLENKGVLKMGDTVKESTLRAYGRDSIRLSATNNPDIWLLDFKV